VVVRAGTTGSGSRPCGSASARSRSRWVVIRFGEIESVAKLTTGFIGRRDSRARRAAVARRGDAIAIGTCVLLAAFVLGIAYRIVAPLAAAGLLWTLSYRNSWGLPFHTENLFVLHVIALSVMPAADVWAVWPRRRAPAVTGLWLGHQAARGADRVHVPARRDREAADRGARLARWGAPAQIRSRSITSASCCSAIRSRRSRRRCSITRGCSARSR